MQELDNFSRFPAKRFDSTSRPTPPARLPQSHSGQSLSSGQYEVPPPLTDKGKTLVSSQKGTCFNCKQPEHFAAQYPKRSLVIDSREEEKGDSHEETYDPPTIEDVEEEEEYDQLAMIKLSQPSKLNLGVVRCDIAQPLPSYDWRRTSILTTTILINDKTCKILINSESCVNAISRNTVNRKGLKPVQYPKPYKVS